MKRLISSLAVLGVLALAACSSTPQQRIDKNQTQFSQYSPEIQQKIRDGKVDVGFSAQMVTLALGDPARTFTRSTAEGTVEVWVYTKSSPRFSFGLGVGSYGRSSGVSTGVGVSTGGGGYDPDELMRVELRGGVVTAVEYVSNRR
ncbi:hypothetical protein [Oleiharenicola lentus]|uniref:hypothetical protein n=1 Tax=Oleiharenicola lentus TaxID=2508720 RepID=UPI003F666241